MTIADHLRAYSKAYPIEVFPKVDEATVEVCHKTFPHLVSGIYAESERNFARQALEGADELDRLEAENERLLKDKLKAFSELFTATELIKSMKQFKDEQTK